MLVRLFGSNFRSLRQPFELSMVAADLKSDENHGIIPVRIDGYKEPLNLLRCVGIYGANASGKSTVLTAANALMWIGLSSSRVSEPEGRIPPYEPFILDDESRSAPIEIGCEVIFKKSLLKYSVTYSDKRILTEELLLRDGKRECVLISRQKEGNISGELVEKGEANRLYVKAMQPNVSVLSKLAQHGPQSGEESILPYFRAIRGVLRHADYSTSAGMLKNISMWSSKREERFIDDPDYRKWIMDHLIRNADVGICEVEARREALDVPDAIREIAKRDATLMLPEKEVVVSFVHSGKVSRAIDFQDESSGTQKLFNISHDWWSLANEPGSFFADELGASLHPRLFDRMIRAINHKRDARVGSQLIFTTHETGLLESYDGQPAALRRDQVYFTKKGASGESELYSLTEFKNDARSVHNIRKRYLSGLYDALPLADRISL